MLHSEIESVNGALLEVLNWKSMGYLGDSSHIKVVFYNFGSTNITSATIDWKFNNISQPSIHWTGNLALEESDTIELDPIFYNAGANELMVWINNLGLLNDTSHFDDTVSVSNLVCDSMLNGYYTIGSTAIFLIWMRRLMFEPCELMVRLPLLFNRTYYQTLP